jgi:hypothetical protein
MLVREQLRCTHAREEVLQFYAAQQPWLVSKWITNGTACTATERCRCLTKVHYTPKIEGVGNAQWLAPIGGAAVRAGKQNQPERWMMVTGGHGGTGSDGRECRAPRKAPRAPAIASPRARNGCQRARKTCLRARKVHPSARKVRENRRFLNRWARPPCFRRRAPEMARPGSAVFSHLTGTVGRRYSNSVAAASCCRLRRLEAAATRDDQPQDSALAVHQTLPAGRNLRFVTCIPVAGPKAARRGSEQPLLTPRTGSYKLRSLKYLRHRIFHALGGPSTGGAGCRNHSANEPIRAPLPWKF